MAATPLLYITFSSRPPTWAAWIRRHPAIDIYSEYLERCENGQLKINTTVTDEICKITADFHPADLLAQQHDEEGKAFYNDTTL